MKTEKIEEFLQAKNKIGAKKETAPEAWEYLAVFLHFFFIQTKA